MFDSPRRATLCFLRANKLDKHHCVAYLTPHSPLQSAPWRKKAPTQGPGGKTSNDTDACRGRFTRSSHPPRFPAAPLHGFVGPTGQLTCLPLRHCYTAILLYCALLRASPSVTPHRALPMRNNPPRPQPVHALQRRTIQRLGATRYDWPRRTPDILTMPHSLNLLGTAAHNPGKIPVSLPCLRDKRSRP